MNYLYFGWLLVEFLNIYYSFFHTHTHTSRGKPVWVSPTSTSTIWEADAPEVVGAINISWNVSRSTRGVGREKWHIAMNSLWRLHHENKKINHKDINSLTLKWNQQRIIHVRVHLYTHTHIAYKNKDWRHPALLDQHKRTGIVSMISTTAKHSHSGSINQNFVIGCDWSSESLLGKFPKAMTPPSTSPPPSSPFWIFLAVLGLLFQESDRPEGWEAPLGGFQWSSQSTTWVPEWSFIILTSIMARFQMVLANS